MVTSTTHHTKCFIDKVVVWACHLIATSTARTKPCLLMIPTPVAMMLVEVVDTIPMLKKMIGFWTQTTRICQTLPMKIGEDQMWSNYHQF